MLTPRELAASEYNDVMALGGGFPVGIDRADMVSVTEDRCTRFATPSG